jgi:subtilase family serine protease
VAALADPNTGVYDCDNISCGLPNSSNEDGGTSLSTPLWAGFVAAINSFLTRMRRPAVGFINPALYSMASIPAIYGAAFHDITCPPGRPRYLCTNGKYRVRRGWDAVTGLGTPDVYRLALAFAAMQSPKHTAVRSAFSATRAAVISHRRHTARRATRRRGS